MIMKKAGAISLTRIMRLLADGCQLAKQKPPTLQEVVNLLSRELAYGFDNGQFWIAKAELIFD